MNPASGGRRRTRAWYGQESRAGTLIHRVPALGEAKALDRQLPRSLAVRLDRDERARRLGDVVHAPVRLPVAVGLAPDVQVVAELDVDARLDVANLVRALFHGHVA